MALGFAPPCQQWLRVSIQDDEMSCRGWQVTNNSTGDGACVYSTTDNRDRDVAVSEVQHDWDNSFVDSSRWAVNHDGVANYNDTWLFSWRQ